jgi:3-isopropylmalate/(R)-2-methylmalate dehydratase large subunit
MDRQVAPQTLAQKLIARAAGKQSVRSGEILNCAIDLAMFHDSSGPRRLGPMLEALGTGLWDRDRVVLVIDHYVPEADDESRRIVRMAREWAVRQQLRNVHDSIGICHVVLPEQGHLRPGMFCVGGDSHSSTGGAFGTYTFGVGSTEMLGAVVTGQIWVKVPDTIAMRWAGRLQPGVTAKDMMLHMIGRFGMNGARYQAVEYSGDAVRGMSMRERMTLSNMSAELGAQVGLVAPDGTTQAFLRDAGVEVPDVEHWRTDAGAAMEAYDFDAAALSPQVAAPHSPANTGNAADFEGTPVQLVYIGACTGAKLDDLRAAASVLRGRSLAPGVSLVVAPASARDRQLAKEEGVLQVLEGAGARLLDSSCGACAGYGATVSGDLTVVSTTARNFKGRMGSENARVYLASPYTAAAAAIAGAIVDPREFLQ